MDSLITLGSGAPESELEPGTYPATLRNVVGKTITVKGEDSEVFEWTFGVATEDPEVEIPVNGLTSRMTGPKSKVWSFLQALGFKVESGASFSATDLIGRECLVNVELNGNGYPKVTGIVAKPRTSAAPRRAQPVSAQVAEPEGDDGLPF